MHKLLYTGVLMKKKFLPYVGIISAGILTTMFIGIFAFGFFPSLPPGIINSISVKSTNDTSIILANLTENTVSQRDFNRTSDVQPQDSNTVYIPHLGYCIRSSKFITIDNIPDMMRNRTYNITGITDLPTGEELIVKVLPLEYDFDINLKNQSMTGTLMGAVGNATVLNGNGNLNLWSFELQTGQLDPDSRKYFVNVSNDRFDPWTSAIISGDAFCTQKFTLKG